MRRVFSVESFWLPLIVVTAVSVIFSMALSRRRADLRRARQEEATLLAQLRGLKQQNERLRAERDALLTSASQVERVAREEYGFRGPGETVSEFRRPHSAEKGRSIPLPAEDKWDRILKNGEFPWAIPLSVFGASVIVLAAVNRIALGEARTNAAHERRNAGTVRGSGWQRGP